MRASSILFPQLCYFCKSLGPLVCPRCASKLHPVEADWCVRCGHVVADGVACTRCAGHPVGPSVASLWHLKGLMRDAVWAVKYNHTATLIPELLTWMAIRSLAKLIFVSGLVSNPVLVPVPLHPKQQMKRGYNQADLIAQAIGTLLNVPVNNKLLSRKRETLSQTHTYSRKERETNIRGAFEIVERQDEHPQSVIIVDDVITSGATIREAANELARHHIRAPCALCFAREKHTPI